MAIKHEVNYREICERLLHAETEIDVKKILIENGYWDDRSSWKPYGDIRNNRSIVGNQQSSPVAALVEKLVNSIDAVLTGECLKNNILPTSHDAPPTMREAVAKFFGVKDGLLGHLTSSERTSRAEHIQLIACGTKDSPAYIIVDTGEGQCPEQFPQTFLSLVRENKTGIPFVQGKFNMGGTGVLQFAGRNSFQLIISKRQPEIAKINNESNANLWGFTLIRRLSPSEQQPQSMYVYLAPNNQIPAFECERLLLKPGRYPEAYSEPLLAGTCIKIWEYKFPGRLKTLATLDLRYALEKFLPEPVLPIRILERRQGYRANYYDTTMSGLTTVLADSIDKIEFQSSSILNVLNVGNAEIRLFVMKEHEDDKHANRYPIGVLFVVNGQLHSEQGKEFISRKAKLDYVADSLIVVVDCTGLPQEVREDLFMASRDRMRHCDERDAIEDAIIEYLKENPGLKELNARRRQHRLSKGSEEETAKVMQNLVKMDPTLANLFGIGKRITVSGGKLPDPEPYDGQRFPTFFQIKKEPKEGLVRKSPINWTLRIEFETDATNDYFARLVEPGRISTRGSLQLVSYQLWNGKAYLRFSIPKTANIGDKLKIDVEVTDISRVSPLLSHFIVEVEETAQPPNSSPHPNSKESQFVGLPNIQEIRRDSWAIYSFDEKSAIALKTGEDDALDIFINMDNIYLKNEIARRKEINVDSINHWFKYGLVLMALGILHREKDREAQRNEGEENGPDCDIATFDNICKTCEGIAITLIPTILQLGKEVSH